MASRSFGLDRVSKTPKGEDDTGDRDTGPVSLPSHLQTDVTRRLRSDCGEVVFVSRQLVCRGILGCLDGISGFSEPGSG